MTDLVVGSHNLKKRDELVDLLRLPGLELKTLAEFGAVPEVEEDGDTFQENALKKAVGYARRLRRWVLADDSGLCVDALHGEPGVDSAYFAGRPRDDERNNNLLLERLAGVPPDARTAYYVCVLTIADPDGVVRASVEGRCHGRIAQGRAGAGGFGYDPLFLFADGDLTFGELPAAVKRQHSHRANAVAKLRTALVDLLPSFGDMDTNS
ncbi:MAG: non-canonical purine NTP pyrophosphatase [Planctomycetia bacterium]